MRGWKFGRLTVLFKISNAWDGHPIWLTWCECGNLHLVRGGNLRSGRTSSCGCLYSELKGLSNYSHGLSYHPLYVTWLAMIQKCDNPRDPRYPRYGALGIGVCDEWQRPTGIIQFIKDMGPREDKHYLTLIDRSEDFSPDNCVWAPIGADLRKRQFGRLVTWRGQTRNLHDWSRILGIPKKTLAYRIENWDVDRAFTTPLRNWTRKGLPRKRTVDRERMET
jgi:hypothetical protein